jgi:hypothetical protein
MILLTKPAGASGNCPGEKLISMRSLQIRLTIMKGATLFAVGAYLIYEFIFVRTWAVGLFDSNPVNRVDLFFIYPVLLILMAISLAQYLRKK